MWHKRQSRRETQGVRRSEGVVDESEEIIGAFLSKVGSGVDEESRRTHGSLSAVGGDSKCMGLNHTFKQVETGLQHPIIRPLNSTSNDALEVLDWEPLETPRGPKRDTTSVASPIKELRRPSPVHQCTGALKHLGVSGGTAGQPRR